MARENSVETKRMGNFDMASAADRVLAFWEKYPKGKISTEQLKEGDLLVFKSYIWKDKKDYIDLAKVPGIAKDVLLSSADAEGTAKQGSTKAEKKDFEKLETISVGRALALLGFAKDGQIASTEEMENFLEYQDQKMEDEVETAIEFLKESETVEALQKNFLSLPNKLRGDSRIREAGKTIKTSILEKEKKDVS